MKASVRSALAVALVLPALTTAKTHKVSDFDWDTITPRDDLAYHDCYEEYKCARLQVPLNWLNESDARRATIAMIKLPAIVPETDKTFGGPIFTNPGGPGGSGVQQALTTAHRLRNFTATPGKRNFEIVSFDPRGIGLTVPSSDCFQTDKLSRDAQTFETRGVGRLDGGGNAIPYSLAMAEGTSRRCIETEMLFGEGMAYANTPSVARDMIAMLDRIYELRRGKSHSSTEEDRLELKKRRPASSFGTQPEGQDRDVDVPRLQYMGFSYGTILGNYFASLFPGRVGKLVLDGVSNADDYATGPVSLFLHLYPSSGPPRTITLHGRSTNLHHHRAGQPTWLTLTKSTTSSSKVVSRLATTSALSSNKTTQTPTTSKQESGNGSTT